MSDTTQGLRSMTFGAAMIEDQDGETLRDGLMLRALRHARTRALMQNMVQRHAMHRRMMHRAMRHATDD